MTPLELQRLLQVGPSGHWDATRSPKMTPFTQGTDRHECKIMSGTAMLPWTTHRQLSLIIITMIQNKLLSVPEALAIIGLSYTEQLPAKPTMLGTAVRQGARVLVACVRGSLNTYGQHCSLLTPEPRPARFTQAGAGSTMQQSTALTHCSRPEL